MEDQNTIIEPEEIDNYYSKIVIPTLKTPQLLFFCAYKIQGDNKQPEKSTF